MAEALWRQEQAIGGLREVRFSFECAGETVPGLLILPENVDAKLPLVFIQHPATSSKDDYFVRDVGLTWARRGWACAGLDAPMHGDRATYDPMRLLRDRERFPEVAAQFAGELSMAVDLLAAEFPVDVARLGYVGYSMGSMLGVQAVARDGRFKAAAFCLVGEGGLVGAATGPESVIPLLAGVAVRIVAKTHDEFFSREATEALYNALPGEKDLVWLPGGHFEIGQDVINAAAEWMAAKL
jgi:dienelactone hydrolase